MNVNYKTMTELPFELRTDKKYMDWYHSIDYEKDFSQMKKFEEVLRLDIEFCRKQTLFNRGIILAIRYNLIFRKSQYTTSFNTFIQQWTTEKREKERTHPKEPASYYFGSTNMFLDTLCAKDLLCGNINIFDVPFIYRGTHEYYCAHVYALNLKTDTEKREKEDEIASLMLLDMLEYKRRGAFENSKHLEVNYITTFLNSLYF